MLQTDSLFPWLTILENAMWKPIYKPKIRKGFGENHEISSNLWSFINARSLGTS